VIFSLVKKSFNWLVSSFGNFLIATAFMSCLVNMIWFNTIRLSAFQYGLKPNAVNGSLFFWSQSFCFVPFLACLGLIFAVVVVLFIEQDKMSSKQITLRIIIIIILCALTVGTTRMGGSYNHYIMNGFQERMQKQLDISAIKLWLSNLEEKDFSDEWVRLESAKNKKWKDNLYRNVIWPDNINWPESIKIFAPGYVRLWAETISDRRLLLEWGGTLPGRWGVVVSLEAAEIPPTVSTRHDIYYTRKLAEEAYIYYRH
jgi:hypothetical protein